ncbi:MAG TPA: Nramp family divalent metal transporter [Actinophytocola sp.]|uniref:Nramp family divalent metal transporter n=1 Tax=Actinophytocola sp. TaxID=1872138 RepID=UPI002DB6B379|nr:Nramp family divalent metal transporter [Actinophytocola sp.]HEU5471462.1 Nramp family divalent metal transporter [Actinophytocola sp.]
MARSTDTDPVPVPDTEVHAIGVSRPPLGVDDLPQPEEVFKTKSGRLGTLQIIQFVIGPSLIALGISIGSGEWLLGPQAVGSFGFVGIGWVITVSAILQTFYNVEVSRYVVATGEVPVVGWGRVPPGWKFWVPVSLLVFYFAFIFGGWAAAAGQGLFALITGRVHTADELEYTRLLAIALLLLVFLITVLARKVSRTLELTNWFLVGALLLILIIVDLAIVPFSVWWDGIRGLLTPAAPPAGITATTLGALAGFTALASGLNWYAMNHYRDKGYGMGHKVGFISGMRGEKTEIQPVGVTFRDTPENAARWKRWYGLLKVDQWIVFFIGAMLGMLLPTILMAHVVATSGERPTTANVPTFTAEKLGEQYGQGMFYLMLTVGVFILFSTQLGIFEALVRNFTDSVHAVSPRMRRVLDGDPRKFYYPYMLIVLAVIAGAIHLATPVKLVQISANMSNLGALIFPFMLMYLNTKLPKAARPRWWHHLFLVLNFLFFGFFFVNFVYEFFSGSALVKF